MGAWGWQPAAPVEELEEVPSGGPREHSQLDRGAQRLGPDQSTLSSEALRGGVRLRPAPSGSPATTRTLMSTQCGPTPATQGCPRRQKPLGASSLCRREPHSSPCMRCAWGSGPSQEGFSPGQLPMPSATCHVLQAARGRRGQHEGPENARPEVTTPLSSGAPPARLQTLSASVALCGDQLPDPGQDPSQHSASPREPCASTVMQGRARLEVTKEIRAPSPWGRSGPARPQGTAPGQRLTGEKPCTADRPGGGNEEI